MFKSAINFLVELIQSLPFPIVLLSGPEEDPQVVKNIIQAVGYRKLLLLTNNAQNTLREYMTIINACDLVLTGDTLTLHVALALGKKTVGMFFCTPDWEVEDYGRLKKLVSPLLKENFYTNENLELLRQSISVEEVFSAIREQMG